MISDRSPIRCLRFAGRRLNIRLWFVAVLVDVVVAAVVSGFAFDRENWLINTFWVWLSIQIVRIRYVILGAIRLLAFQWMGGFGPDKTGFLTALETNNFPAPEAYVLRLMITWAVSGIMRMRTMRRDLRLLQMLGARQGIRLWPAF
jgi:hypothetical protein